MSESEVNPFAANESGLEKTLKELEIPKQTESLPPAGNKPLDHLIKVAKESNKRLALDETLKQHELELKVKNILKHGMDSQQQEKALSQLRELFNF